MGNKFLTDDKVYMAKESQWYKGHASAYVVQIRKQLTCRHNVAKYNEEDLNLSLNLLDNIDKVTYRFLTEFCTPSFKWL